MYITFWRTYHVTIEFLLTLEGVTDIVVHKKLPGGKIKEFYEASGGSWGGSSVDEEYLQLLTSIYGEQVFHQFQMDYTHEYLDMMREFRNKRTIFTPDIHKDLNIGIDLPTDLNKYFVKHYGFTPQDAVENASFPLKGQIQVSGDTLLVSSNLIKDMFKSVTDNIVNHLSNLMANLTDNPTLMILVGEFSLSQMVQTAINDRFKTIERTVIIPLYPEFSVVKGAAIFGHALDIVTHRVVRYNYGGKKVVPFDSKLHSENYKFYKDNKPYVNVFEKFISIGALVKNDYEIAINRTLIEINIQDTCVLTAFYASNDVQYVEESGSNRLCFGIDFNSGNTNTFFGTCTLVNVTSRFGRTELDWRMHVDCTTMSTSFPAYLNLI